MRLPAKSEIALSIFGVLLALFIGELCARYWFNNLADVDDLKRYGLPHQIPATAWRIRPHHYLNYSLTPNFQRDKLSHNSLGYRGGEFQKNKPDSLFRIVCIGGSTTYTEFVNDNAQTYPALLQEILRTEYNLPNVEVINAGVPGYNSWESLINLEFRVLDLNPDLVIVYHGTNDVHPRFVPPEKYQSDNSGWRRQWAWPVPKFYDKSDLLRIIRRKLGFYHQVVLSGLTTQYYRDLGMDKSKILDKNPPIYFERNLKSMVGLAKAHGFKMLLATWAYSPHLNDYAGTPEYIKGFTESNKIVKKVGAEMGAPIFDFASLMPTQKDYWFDGRHVNEKGAYLKASLFAKYLEESNLFAGTGPYGAIKKGS